MEGTSTIGLTSGLIDLSSSNTSDLKIQARIIFSITEQGEPMTLGKIAKKIDESKSKVVYHLKHMLTNGTIFRVEPCFEGEHPTYHPQVIFFEKEYIKELLEKFSPVLELMLANMDLDDPDKNEETVKANLRIAAELFSLISEN